MAFIRLHTGEGLTGDVRVSVESRKSPHVRRASAYDETNCALRNAERRSDGTAMTAATMKLTKSTKNGQERIHGITDRHGADGGNHRDHQEHEGSLEERAQQRESGCLAFPFFASFVPFVVRTAAACVRRGDSRIILSWGIPHLPAVPALRSDTAFPCGSLPRAAFVPAAGKCVRRNACPPRERSAFQAD